MLYISTCNKHWLKGRQYWFMGNKDLNINTNVQILGMSIGYETQEPEALKKEGLALSHRKPACASLLFRLQLKKNPVRAETEQT